MDWDKLRAFNAAAETGSFTNAGELLRLSQSAVSRQIFALEEGLRTSLFHRHARGLKLTDQGKLLHCAVREVMARLSMAETHLMEMRDQPRGPLKISADVAFGAFWLAPRLKEFHEQYPEIALTLRLDGGKADLVMGEADAAITLSVPRQTMLLQRRILSTRSYAYAAPDYLKRHGAPARLEELRDHRLVVQGDFDADWLLVCGTNGGRNRQPVAALDNIHGLYRAIWGGLGIGALPHFIAPETTGLVRVLPDFASPRIDGYFVYPEALRQSKRIAVFRDFLLRKLTEDRLHFDASERSVLPVEAA
jgi:DNA-binding transcriptional LysR family regulator